MVKINTTLRPIWFPWDLGCCLLFHPRLRLGRKINNNLGPKEIIYRPRVVLLRVRPKAERVLLRIRENPEYERPAGRGHAFERLISLEPKARLESGLLCWVPPFLLPCMGPMPNHASTHCGTWRVLPGGMSQMFRLLFLGNGWADCIEIW